MVPETYHNTLVHHDYDWGINSTSVQDEQDRVDALNAAANSQFASALRSLAECRDAASCLQPASLPGTSISSIHTDAAGFHFVSSGIVGEDTRVFPLSFDPSVLRVTVFSVNLNQEGPDRKASGFISFPQGGDFNIRFEDTSGGYRNATVTWFFPGGTRYILVPAGAGQFRVVSTTMTPENTTFNIWAR
jgi:hypothetical protein